MAIVDKGLGVKLITLGDLLDKEPSPSDLDGATVRPCSERARIRRWSDTGRAKDGPTASLSAIKFWVILDCGEPGARFFPDEWPGTGLLKRPRPDRYIPVGVGVDQEVADVEVEEQGKALPDIYYSWDEACEASSDLCAVAKIHES